jgi:hypothetical protein
MGLLIATKLSALPLALVLIVVALFATGWVKRLDRMVLGVAVALLVSAPFLIQNVVRYGDPLALGATQHYLTDTGGLGTLGRYVIADPLRLIVAGVPAKIFTGFWYTSGWNQFRWLSPWTVPLWAVLGLSLVGLRARIYPRRYVIVLVTLVFAALVSVWLVAFQTASYEARLALAGLPAIACLVGLGTERWRLPIRFALPAMGLVGSAAAIWFNVLSVRWG